MIKIEGVVFLWLRKLQIDVIFQKEKSQREKLSSALSFI